MDKRTLNALNDAKESLLELFEAVEDAMEDGNITKWEAIDLGLEATQVIRDILNTYSYLSDAGRAEFFQILQGVRFEEAQESAPKGPF